MQNKIAIITGASRGVGKEISIYLAEIGYIVILIARNIVELEKVSQVIHSTGGKCVIPLDVSGGMRVKACVSRVINEYGR